MTRKLALTCAARWAAGIGAMALGLSACASNTVQPGSVATSLPVASAPPVAASPQLTIGKAPLPAAFDQPATLVGDPVGRGAYFLAESRTDARVFHWDGTNLRSWSVGDPATDTDLQTSIQNSIAAASNGTVWVGVNSTLIELNLGTGKSTTTRMPAPAGSTGAVKRRPASLAGYHPITGLAVAPNGDLAVTRDAAVDVEVRNHATGAFAETRLPAETVPASIAYDASGTLAIGSSVYSAAGTTALGTGPIELVAPGAVTITHVKLPDTIGDGATVGGHIMPRPGGGFVRISAETTVIAAAISHGVEQTPTIPITPRAELAVEGPIATVTDNVIAVGTKAGLALFNTASGVERDVDFPTFQCDGNTSSIPGVASGAPVATPYKGPCGQRATAISVDHAGTIWALTSGAQNGIAHVHS